MPSYKILQAEKSGSLPATAKRGELAIHSYLVEANGRQEATERLAKPETALPEIGSFVDGTIRDDPKSSTGTRLKIEWNESGPPSGGGGGGGTNYRQLMHPDEQKRVGRSHAQHMAMWDIQNLIATGQLTKYTRADVRARTDWFEDDAAGRSPAPPSEVPVDTEGLPTVDDALAESKEGEVEVPF